MFSKLAIRNIKKSIRDYAVYFLTLTLGVCIFYVFNSIESQTAMMEMSASTESAVQAAVMILNVVSVFVSVVLAFLIIYANQFMIRRRKKELGIYLTLGMPQGKISGMLVLETVVIGLLALAVGLAAGVFLSQGLAVVTARLFDVRIVDFHFVFSEDAFFKSILYFGVIFLVVVLFNSASIRKFKLIDLLYAGRKNEELKLRKASTTVICFIAGIALIVLSYLMVIVPGAGMILYSFAPALGVNIAGTMLFFMALSGFLLKSAQADKKRYYKGLNMFVMRQLNSKINTNFVSMAFICTMLFLTIVVLSTVTSFNAAFNREAENSSPFDVSFTIHETEGGAHTTLAESLPKVGVDEDELFARHYEYNVYETDVPMVAIAPPNVAYLTDEAAERVISETTLEAVGLSDYNAVMEMQGKEPVALGENEFGVASVTEPRFAEIEAYLGNPVPLNAGGRELVPAPGLGILPGSLWTTYNGYQDMALVVPDSVASGLAPSLDVYVADYAGDPAQREKQLDALTPNFGEFKENAGITIKTATRIAAADAMTGMTTSMIFVGIYMGLTFLIAAAAILALQQLSAAADNKERYDLLKKLGADEKMVDKSILTQVGLYFFIPLAMAAVHSVVGVWVMNEGIVAFGSVNVIWSAVLAAVFMAIVYGGYFLATYLGCRNITHGRRERAE